MNKKSLMLLFLCASTSAILSMHGGKTGPLSPAPKTLEHLYNDISTKLNMIIEASNDLETSTILVEHLYRELAPLPNERILVLTKAKSIHQTQKTELKRLYIQVTIDCTPETALLIDNLEKDIQVRSTKVLLLEQIINRCNALASK